MPSTHHRATAPPLAGTLPPLCVERPADRWVWGITALLLVAAFAWVMSVYWTPAHPGVDQNGYLVGGKLFATTASNGFRPENQYSFVGRMWVEAADGRVFPKYPLGLSALYALTLELGGASHGLWLTFLVSPVMMTLSLAATFFLVRQLAGSFAGVLAVLIVGTSPVTMGLADNPNSHATALCLVTWGMVLAMQWWQKNGLWRAILAGLLIGSAVTIRYTEGLVAIPMGLIALLNLRWRDRRSWIHVFSMLAAWALPVGLLTLYNWLSFHHLTGYDPTNESTGFRFEWFKANWETMLRAMYNTGLFFVLPFSLMGLVLMWRWNARVALVMAAWVLPNLTLYTFYYWAPDNSSISYLRFFLTIFPPLALAAAWSAKWFIDLAAQQQARWAPVLAIGAALAVTCGMDTYNALGIMEPEAQINASVQAATRQVTTVCPKGSTIFASDQFLNYLQFAGDYHLYDMQQFSRQQVQRLANIDPNQPNGLQPQRAKELYDRLRNATDSQLIANQNQLMTAALASGQRVFLIFPAQQSAQAYRFVTRRMFSSTIAGSWSESPDPRIAQRRLRAFGPNAGGPPGFAGGGGFGGRAARLGRRRDLSPPGGMTWDILEIKPGPATVSSIKK